MTHNFRITVPAGITRQQERGLSALEAGMLALVRKSGQPRVSDFLPLAARQEGRSFIYTFFSLKNDCTYNVKSSLSPFTLICDLQGKGFLRIGGDH